MHAPHPLPCLPPPSPCCCCHTSSYAAWSRPPPPLPCLTPPPLLLLLPHLQFCSLEPEIVCRLVYVREVEVLDGVRDRVLGGGGASTSSSAHASAAGSYARLDTLGGAGAGAGAGAGTGEESGSVPLLAPVPPAGLTELPTCPVCLERLDEHISGIVTTVRWRVKTGGKPREGGTPVGA